MFAASCAERLAQFFTGLRGDDPARAGDVEILLEALDELWDTTLSGSVFAVRAGQLEWFVEIVRADNGEELTTAVDAYGFHSVLCVLHAVGYRGTGDSDEAVWCAHVGLTAVGLLDQNVQVSESLCLGDLRCAAGDEPRLVAVPQTVERQSGSDRHRADAWQRTSFVAVDCGFEYAADESAAPQPCSGYGGEHELVVVPFEVLAEHGDDKRRQGDRAGG